jgi:hypothetical protein
MTGRMSEWMTKQMDEMMLHITTSFNICNATAHLGQWPFNVN